MLPKREVAKAIHLQGCNPSVCQAVHVSKFAAAAMVRGVSMLRSSIDVDQACCLGVDGSCSSVDGSVT